MTTPDRTPGDNIEEEELAAGGSESLDEDRIGSDPFEEGNAPPDDWAESDRFGTTAGEAQRGESLDQRLAQEDPDED